MMNLLCIAMLSSLAGAVQLQSATNPSLFVLEQPGASQTASGALKDGVAGHVMSTEFVVISSPELKKVTYTVIQNFLPLSETPLVLIDSGLVQPRGLVMDRQNGTLYVADFGAQAIFRYSLVPVMGGATPTLRTTGARLIVMQGHPVESLTLSEDGDLFYTAPDTNNVNKIPSATLKRLGEGRIIPSELVIMSQKTAQFQEMMQASYVAAQKASGLLKKQLPVDPPAVEPRIFSMYEAYLNPNVSSPAGVYASGSDLYWVNNINGFYAGTVVKGATHPKSVTSMAGPTPFPTNALAYNSNQGWGVAKAKNIIVFTRTSPFSDRMGMVSAMMEGTDIITDLSTNLMAPRGLVYDNGETMYVADVGLGHVYGFPCGRMMGGAPLTKVAQMKGAYGVALLSSSDPVAFWGNTDTKTTEDVSDTYQNGNAQFGFQGAARGVAPAALTVLAALIGFMCC